MSLTDTPLAILNDTEFSQSQKNLQSQNISTNLPGISTYKSSKAHYNSRSSDSGKSSSCSPILLDCSFDSGIAGVLFDDNGMQLHKRIQQCQYILLALERDQEYFLTIRNRLSKITNRKSKESNGNELFCNVCCAEINANDEKTFAKCYVCKKYICRNIKCADWLPNTFEWECQLCQTSKHSLAQTSSWVADQISFNQEKLICSPRARSEVYIPITEYNDSLIHFESVSQIGVNPNTITAEQKLKIREYVEEVVAKLLGGNLDTAAVNQISKSENYLNLFHKYHSKLSNILINLENVLTSNKDDLPDTKVKNIQNGSSRESVCIRANSHDFSDISETRLRQMVQKIIAETMSLPPLTNGHAVSEVALDRSSKSRSKKSLADNGYNLRHRTEHYFEPTIYQDLLATAVLNKIVDKQLKVKQDASERQTVSGDDDVNDNSGPECADQICNIEKFSTSSGSSVEPQSDCSYPEVEQILNNNDDKSSELLRNSDRDSVMSDYLANHMIPLPDLNAMATESEEEDYTSVTSSAIGDGTWEKNWLFKKKRSALSASVTTSSIGMLVPDPKEDVRAQIGDKTADEVSDLSELGSDSDDSLNSLRSQLEPINDRLVNKHLIGGQNSKIILDEIIERSSIISNTLPNDAEPIYTDACNEYIIDATIKNQAINDNVNQQKNKTEQKVGSILVEPTSSSSLKGSIAEREYKKWYNAVEMPNNPYAPEALRRRISGSQERFIDLPTISPTKNLNAVNLLNESKLQEDENVKLENDYKRYSRDYYINSNLTTPQLSPAKDFSKHVAKENQEVKNNYNNISRNKPYQNNSRNANTTLLLNYYHWTLSAPVRRSSSLKDLKKRIRSPSHSYIHAPTYHPISTPLKARPSTSNSYYSYFNNLNNNDTEDEEDNIDLHSQRSWKCNLNPKSKRTTSTRMTSSTKTDTENDVYKAVPVKVVEVDSSSMETTSLTPTEAHANFTSTSDDSDTIKVNDFAKNKSGIEGTQDVGIAKEIDSGEKVANSVVKRSESCGNVITGARGSTPEAFKFLQPKRKLLEPNQVLTTDEEEPQVEVSQLEKPVIEAEVAKALPSVKALARAFLMTTNTTQPQKLWLRKARTLPQSGKKCPTSPKRSLEKFIQPERMKVEDDVTITSDLSSLETDSSSIGIEIAPTSDLTVSVEPAIKDPSSPTITSDTNPVPVRQGVLKNNIAFFENLKNK